MQSMSEPQVRIARGARATEAALLAEIERHAEQVRRDPARLARPLRIVVPSRSLREHLGARIVRARGTSVLGIAIHTLRGLAFEILRRAGEPLAGDLLFQVVVRQQARREPVLKRLLDGLEDGYGVVASSVSDLLDAGLEPHHGDAIEDFLTQEEGGQVRERAAALARVAASTVGVLEAAGLEHRSALFRRARQTLEREPLLAPPASSLWIHGYADATGVQLELLQVLMRCMGGQVWIDHPDDPGAAGRPDPGVAFTERFRERMAGMARIEATRPPPPGPARPNLVRAPGAHAEARAVTERIHLLLAGGVVPETIGVVARELGPYLVPVRTQLRRLGIPFSGAAGSLGPLAPEGRRVHALLALLRGRETTLTDRWLETLGRLEHLGAGACGRARLADLRIGLHALGAGRVREVAQLDLDQVLGNATSYPLPVRRGFRAVEVEAPEGGEEGTAPAEAPQVSATRRRLHRPLLEEAVAAARSVGTRFAAWVRVRETREHLRQLEALLREDLAWSPEAPDAVALENRLASLRSEMDPGIPMDLEEFVLLLGRALRDFGADPLGGRGGGVRVLSVVEARACTFEHLFLMGMNRDLFPRRVSEDPLLPDRLRRALARDLLPDVPIKQRGFDEERYLFAQLLSASPNVTLSWQTVTDDGKEKTPSPLVERLQGGGRGDAVELVPAPLARPLRAAQPRTPRPAFEHAVLAGLYGSPASFRKALEVAQREVQRDLALPPSPIDPAELARVRCAIVEEIDPSRARAAALGPYFGFVGAARDAADPRRAPVYVTTLENAARCPWQTFLQRLLRLEPVPDSLDALPAADPLLIGSLLHRTLERIVRDALEAATREPGASRAEEGVAVPWPEAVHLERILGHEAHAVARDAGIGLPGFPRLLVERTRPYLERVRVLEWGEGGVLSGVTGAEVTGDVEVPDPGGGSRRICFRADRVDRGPEGLELTDYKTGKPVSDRKTAAKRREQIVAKVGTGQWLQAAAYAWARRPSAVVGRYVFAKPDLGGPEAQATLSRGDRQLRGQFESAVRTVLRAWDAGSFVPRLLDPSRRKESDLCGSCHVSMACLRGDSGARRRLTRWLERNGADYEEAPSRLGEAEQALLGVWRLAEEAR
jgi:hypothetical protein